MTVKLSPNQLDTTMTDRAISDLGGLAGGPIDISEHQPTLSERRIDAMMMLLRKKPRAFWVTDENRRTIESLEPKTYEESAYYERWVLAIRALLIEKGVLSEAEIEAKLTEVRARLPGDTSGDQQ
jgi:hypothetical protein